MSTRLAILTEINYNLGKFSLSKFSNVKSKYLASGVIICDLNMLKSVFINNAASNLLAVYQTSIIFGSHLPISCCSSVGRATDS